MKQKHSASRSEERRSSSSTLSSVSSLLLSPEPGADEQSSAPRPAHVEEVDKCAFRVSVLFQRTFQQLMSRSSHALILLWRETRVCMHSKPITTMWRFLSAARLQTLLHHYCLLSQKVGWDNGWILMKQLGSYRWMNNWLTFEINLIPDGHHS